MGALLERWIVKAARFYVRIDRETESIIMDYLRIIEAENLISENSLKQLFLLFKPENKD